MSLLRKLAGFFVVTLGPVAAQHWMRRADFGEVLDSIVSTAMFTLAYAVGLALNSRISRQTELVPGPVGRLPHPFVRGALAGAVSQAVIWGTWMSMAHDVRYSFGAWPLVFNLLVCSGAAFAVERTLARRLPGTRDASR
jgi:hypothetical protein